MKIACNLPSGVNARNGQADKLSFKADVTVTFHRGKLGLYLQPAVDFCGEILVKISVLTSVARIPYTLL